MHVKDSGSELNLNGRLMRRSASLGTISWLRIPNQELPAVHPWVRIPNQDKSYPRYIVYE